jgi:hypothetical protein
MLYIIALCNLYEYEYVIHTFVIHVYLQYDVDWIQIHVLNHIECYIYILYHCRKKVP